MCHFIITLKFPGKAELKEEVRGPTTPVCDQGCFVPLGLTSRILIRPTSFPWLEALCGTLKTLSICFVHFVIIVARDTSRFGLLWASCV